MFAPGTMLGRARNFFFGPSAAPEGPPEAPAEAKKRRGDTAPLALLRLPDDALVSACAYLGLVDGARAAVTCRRLAAVGRHVHRVVLVKHLNIVSEVWADGRPRTTIFDSSTSWWRFCAPSPAEVDTDLPSVAIGGELCCLTFPFRPTLIDELQLPPIHVYSLKKNAWRTIDHFAHLGALTSFTCCAFGDELCFVGGVLLGTDDPSAMSAARVSVRTLNLQSGAWTRLADMPISIESPSSCACRGKLYVLGYDDENVGDVPVLQIYDPTRRAWSRGPTCPTMERKPSRGSVMHSAGSHVFCIWDDFRRGAGGADFNSHEADDYQRDGVDFNSMVTVFDTETCTWSAFVQSTLPRKAREYYIYTIQQETVIAFTSLGFEFPKFELERVGPSTWAWRDAEGRRSPMFEFSKLPPQAATSSRFISGLTELRA